MIGKILDDAVAAGRTDECPLASLIKKHTNRVVFRSGSFGGQGEFRGARVLVHDAVLFAVVYN